MSQLRNCRMLAIVCEAILQTARNAGDKEFAGLLLTHDPNSPTVDSFLAFPTKASGGSVEVAAEVMQQALQQTAAAGQCAVGIVHSHGNFRPFSSVTDERLYEHFIPELAVRAARGLTEPPRVVSASRAVVPLAGGKQATIQVLGPSLDASARLPAAWLAVETTFSTCANQLPVSVDAAGGLTLTANGVGFRLQLPEEAELSIRVAACAVRQAELFSLVVNRRGEHHVEAFDVLDVDGRLTVDRLPAKLDLVATTAPLLTPNLGWLTFDAHAKDAAVPRQAVRQGG